MNKRKKKSKFGLLVVLGLLAYFIYIMFDQQRALYSKDLEMQNIQAKIKEEDRLNEDLEKQKKILNTDEYIEKVARDKLGMIKPGEKIFIDINK